MSFDFKDCEIKKVKLIDLKMAEYNPRKISDDAFNGLGASLNKFGMMVPIVWNKKTGNIVGGHQRYKHLVEMGETETEVVVVDLEGNEEVALNITLNNPNIRGKFTSEVTRLLKICEAQIGSVFNDIKLNDMFAKLDFGEDKPKEPKKKNEGETGDDNRDVPPEPPSPVTSGDDGSQDAVITCPKCASKWKLKDNTVVVDTTKGETK
jgi:hypothetical protein